MEVSFGCQFESGGVDIHEFAGRNEIILLSTLAAGMEFLVVIVPVSSIVSILTGEPVGREEGTTE